ncbi:MAG: hypothetical protein ACQETC_06500, partial [Thermodesulfobacteriota bacterium]
MTISIFRQKSREVLETRLLDEGLDFSASYMAVKDIRSNLEAIPETLTRQTFDSISRTLLSRRFDKQKQAFFLHREIVQTLVSAPFIHNSPFKADSIRFLRGLLFNGNRDKKRAIYESLGSLDLKHDCRRFGIEPCRRAPELSVDAIFKKLGALNPEAAYWKGRSLLQIQPDGGICAVKFAKSGEEALKLHKEAVWMTRFDNFSMPSGLRFDPPSPLAVQGRPLFAIRNGYKGFSHAIAYTAPADYFDYPNCTGIIQKYSKERIRDVFSRNAWLLGKLASMGV